MWLYKNKEINSIEDMPADTFGFVYLVTHTPSGKKYLGKKQLIANRTLPPLKGQKKKRKIQKESDWKTYYGSQAEIKHVSKGIARYVGVCKRDSYICVNEKAIGLIMKISYCMLIDVLENDEYLITISRANIFVKILYDKPVIS